MRAASSTQKKEHFQRNFRLRRSAITWRAECLIRRPERATVHVGAIDCVPGYSPALLIPLLVVDRLKTSSEGRATREMR